MPDIATDKPRVALLGFTLPDEEYRELLERDPHPPHQTQNFSKALIAALRSANYEISVISALPTSSYPAGRRLFAGGGEFTLDGGSIPGRRIPFINLPVLKHITRLLTLTLWAGRAAYDSAGSVLLVHGVHSPFLVFAALIMVARKTRIVAIVTDPPGVVLSEDGFLVRLFKSLDRRIVRGLLNRFTGVICLSPALRREWVKSATPALVLEGFLAPDIETFRLGEPAPYPKVVYAGGLHAEYGARRLLESATLLRTPGAKVHFFGTGDLDNAIRDVAATSDKVVGPSLVGRQELFREYQSTWLLVQPRPTATTTGEQSFPSKLLEYMATGVPTASTRLPGIPSDYEGYYLPLSDRDGQQMAREIDEYLQQVEQTQREFGHRARQFILSTRSSHNQGLRLRRFLDEITK
jgi:glycosyltransferase involved in cell wall biosynthesis